jgi:hypothetical protein
MEATASSFQNTEVAAFLRITSKWAQKNTPWPVKEVWVDFDKPNERSWDEHRLLHSDNMAKPTVVQPAQAKAAMIPWRALSTQVIFSMLKDSTQGAWPRIRHIPFVQHSAFRFEAINLGVYSFLSIDGASTVLWYRCILATFSIITASLAFISILFQQDAQRHSIRNSIYLSLHHYPEYPEDFRRG